jgi:hypothetical protein
MSVAMAYYYYLLLLLLLLLFSLVVVLVGVFYGAGESMFGLSFELAMQIETTTIK